MPPLVTIAVERDGGPLIAEPATFNVERVTPEFDADVAAFRVSHSVALYLQRQALTGFGHYLPVMSTVNPTSAEVANALVKALGLTLYTAPAPGPS